MAAPPSPLPALFVTFCDDRSVGRRGGESQEAGSSGGFEDLDMGHAGKELHGEVDQGETGYRRQDSQKLKEMREMCFMIGSYVLGQIRLTWVSTYVLSTDTPSSPSIDQVEPYSSTAQVQFDEPEATGGVPILKYKAEWRAIDEEVWHSKWYDAKEGKLESAGLL